MFHRVDIEGAADRAVHHAIRARDLVRQGRAASAAVHLRAAEWHKQMAQTAPRQPWCVGCPGCADRPCNGAGIFSKGRVCYWCMEGYRHAVNGE